MSGSPCVAYAEPADLDLDGLLRGLYRFRAAPDDARPAVRLLASGVAVPWAVAAQERLSQDWGVAAEVWSVTSWGELRRDGVECDHQNLRQPQAEPLVPHVRRVLSPASDGEDPIPVVGVSDWMRAVPDLIRPWVPGPFTTLGTDGFGFSDTRPAARRYFGVDAESITVAALAVLAESGTVDRRVISEAAEKYQVADLP